jgi:hypothetical protein
MRRGEPRKEEVLWRPIPRRVVPFDDYDGLPAGGAKPD